MAHRPDAAALSTSHVPTQNEHTVAGIAELLGDALELLPVLATVRGVPLDAFASLVAAALIGPGHSRPPLDVWGRELGEEAIDVLAVEGINRSLGNVHFVSRA
jgi:hypothetical protein